VHTPTATPTAPTASNVHPLNTVFRGSALIRPVMLRHLGITTHYLTTDELDADLAAVRRRDAQQARLDQALAEREWDTAGPFAQLHAVAASPMGLAAGLFLVAFLMRAVQL
jgi:hypothetical protein